MYSIRISRMNNDLAERLGTIFGCFSVLAWFASLVYFAPVSLSVGIPQAKSPVSCEALMGNWLVVNGSLYYGMMLCFLVALAYVSGCNCQKKAIKESDDRVDDWKIFVPAMLLISAYLIGYMGFESYGLRILVNNEQNVSNCSNAYNLTNNIYGQFQIQVIAGFTSTLLLFLPMVVFFVFLPCIVLVETSKSSEEETQMEEANVKQSQMKNENNHPEAALTVV